MQRPKIGITVSQTEDSLARPWNGTARAYAKAVFLSGGLPILLPLISGSEEEQLAGLDGLLLTGGNDVDPERFGSDPEAGLGEVDPERDAFEINLYQLARTNKKPILGICRGLQLINVIEGGTLYQHLPAENTFWANHLQINAMNKATLGHRVRLNDTTLLAKAFNHSNIRVNSYHHQGIRDLAPGLTIAAWAPDGLIEAFEATGLIAVQWHPEMLFEKHKEQLIPFFSLVEMAKNYQNSSS